MRPRGHMSQGRCVRVVTCQKADRSVRVVTCHKADASAWSHVKRQIDPSAWSHVTRQMRPRGHMSQGGCVRGGHMSQGGCVRGGHMSQGGCVRLVKPYENKTFLFYFHILNILSFSPFIQIYKPFNIIQLLLYKTYGYIIRDTDFYRREKE